MTVEPFEVNERFAGLRSGSYLKLSVMDTGEGIDPKVSPRIFDPFFTTKPVGEGSGMGLSVVHGIVIGHGGSIEVSSKVGEGTRFDVYFPSSKNALNPKRK